MQEIPACVTVNVLPAIVTVPVRDDVLVLAATLRPTLPLPDPLAPDVTVIQPVLLLTAVHVQPLAADTLTVTVPPLEVTLWDVGVIV